MPQTPRTTRTTTPPGQEQQTPQPPTPTAVTTRILRDQQAELVRQYGPRLLLDTVADALTYYAAVVQPHESGGTDAGGYALIQARDACRNSAATLRQEALSFLERF